MVALESQKLNFLLALHILGRLPLLAANFVRLNALLELNHAILIAHSVIHKLLDFLFEVRLAMLSLKLLAHGEGDGALIQRLVGRVRKLHLVAHPEEKQAALGLVERDLSDDLVEALHEEFDAHWAQARLTCLPLDQLLVEHLAQTGHVDARGGRVAHILHEVHALLDPLARR
eukprot:CAMPEP_0185585990 /NCGR_PEP_ID=MMETSP0434-20130131/41973_1 /TAXON_ID=626734 ORGANISM="Favella taraikaensis, Strain Fe Narragansett Bay" /NCGR_SAMPLE_ID=MMETSP0434 /ASSEMBLY_ACC=CAM_ASM_000379 /LENGTH=172 /DNA_ID=CAMNT_0028206753 /DNA_START=238 /DNA_END=756 /DNA_ORIENTATION=-